MFTVFLCSIFYFLGLEQEFTLQLLPDGRSNIDGFICVFDVSLFIYD